jgi:hypothetical protein
MSCHRKESNSCTHTAPSGDSTSLLKPDWYQLLALMFVGSEEGFLNLEALTSYPSKNPACILGRLAPKLGTLGFCQILWFLHRFETI